MPPTPWLAGTSPISRLAILLEEVKASPKDSYVLYQTAETLRGLKRYEEACKYYGRMLYSYIYPFLIISQAAPQPADTAP